MIDYAPYLSGTPLRRLRQAQAYLDDLGVPASKYLVSSDGAAKGGDNVRIIYSNELYGGRAPACVVSLAGHFGWIVLQTHLYDAVRSLVILHRDPDMMARVQSLDSLLTHERVCEALALDYASIVKPQVSASEIGNYIAPQDGRFISFSVDSHGELTQEADADDIVALFVQYALTKDYSDRNIGAEFARFAIP